MTPDDRFYDRALERIGRGIAVFAAVGTLAALAWRGWPGAMGFALGAAVSWINYRWIRRAVGSLGSMRPARTRVAVLAGLRYLILGAGAYVILRFFKISVPAALAGLFVPAAAVIVEMVFQLVYARN
jgi:hypothetical protein